MFFIKQKKKESKHKPTLNKFQSNKIIYQHNMVFNQIMIIHNHYNHHRRIIVIKLKKCVENPTLHHEPIGFIPSTTRSQDKNTFEIKTAKGSSVETKSNH